MNLSDGFITKKLREEFMKLYKIEPYPHVLTLDVNENTSGRLYFWQLYSVLGEDEMTEIITIFYRDVLSDQEDKLFRETFKESGTLEHHVKKQVNFWVDVTGGGKRYPGGEARLELHHDNAKIIMTHRGAARWLYHMRNALRSRNFQDPRIAPCINEFVNFFMYKYGKQYNFKSRF
jgi:truncated hemoglobin YjbI